MNECSLILEQVAKYSLYNNNKTNFKRSMIILDDKKESIRFSERLHNLSRKKNKEIQRLYLRGWILKASFKTVRNLFLVCSLVHVGCTITRTKKEHLSVPKHGLTLSQTQIQLV